VADTTVDSLVLDLLEWLGPEPRPYGEVLDAWRTSCPRLPVWEEANARGLVIRHFEPERGQTVSVSEEGREVLRTNSRTVLTGAGSPHRWGHPFSP
jgi:D-3-phosphoglycerate dehydrogenase / 2-oxoglutarate reductase